MQHQGLLSERGVAADQLVERFFARVGLHQRIDCRLELLRRGTFEKDLLARKLVDDLVTPARWRVHVLRRTAGSLVYVGGVTCLLKYCNLRLRAG